MIDFVRVNYQDKNRLEHFVMNKENFKKVYTVLEYHSGEILYPYKTNLSNMEIVINEKGGYVKNSLHKLNNLLMTGEEQNYNDFGYSELCAITDYLKDNVIDVMETKLTQLEYGFNINVPRSAESIIKETVLMHNLKRHTALRKFDGKGLLLEFEYDNFIIKIYDKAKQYSLDENKLRFEIKFKKAIEFNKLGVYNLTDLKNKEILGNLFKYLMKRLNELIIVDNYSENLEIEKTDIDKLNAYSSFMFWETMTRKTRNDKSEFKTDYFKLLEKYDLLKTKNMLKNQLVQKFEKLLNE
ncbi:hypothetical protein JE945_002336 [Flavobacterium psychrophilum]|uniref:hypothetical protein n=1 Tax=Flavobacterium psychrophilum TaxID=96345 RepID=UPI000B7C2182|nr:hypothetical protein [Flavobacterium psychrophilum]EKT4553153.1 hypothetical protein [Flavobacterium psychrophilum]SNB12290.1 conserved hypothetical protein [Flavobacterium psychrophilum]